MARLLLQLGMAGALLSLGAGVACCQTPTVEPAPPVDARVPTVETLAGGNDSNDSEGEIAATEGDEPYAAPGSEEAPSATTPSDADDAARLKIWLSPEMVAARKYVEEYGQRSVQFNSQAAARYLDQLRRSSPLEMQAWLARYTARRAATARSEAVARAARQTAVEQTMARLQAVQQSYENFNAGQTAGALIARERHAGQQFAAGQLGIAKQANRDITLSFQNAADYRWIIDPPLWVKERAAAASVPGDLPAGDPRNFLRGDAPVPGDPGGLGAGTIDPAFAAGAAGAGGGAGAGAGAAAGGGEGAGGSP